MNKHPAWPYFLRCLRLGSSSETVDKNAEVAWHWFKEGWEKGWNVFVESVEPKK